MKYSVVLQEPFDYAPIWIPLGIGLILLAVLLWRVFAFVSSGKSRAAVRGGSSVSSAPAGMLWRIRLFFRKRRQLRHLRKMETRFRKGTLDKRALVQGLSREVRQFAQRATGLPVESLVYSELPGLGFPRLTKLIGELYEPEFAERSDAELEELIQKSKELIREWG